MKTYREELWFETPGRRAFLNITPKVERALAQSGIGEGLCLVNAMHITASVFINDDESGLHTDYERWLEGLAPFSAGSDPARGGYLHNRTGEDNADAHLKRQVMGREVVVAVTAGKRAPGSAPCSGSSRSGGGTACRRAREAFWKRRLRSSRSQKLGNFMTALFEET
jgi:secondary thiamine-phosphate synthase enzyme